MQKKRMVILGAALAFTMALLLTLYPLISNYINQKYASEIHTSYQEAVEQAEDGELEQARKLAQDYNASIVPGAADSNAYSQEALLAASADYESQLNILGDGTMGYIQIPKIDVLLPILHGTEADVLERGIGHLLGSSLPVGGESTHTVLTGHSGMEDDAIREGFAHLRPGSDYDRLYNAALCRAGADWIVGINATRLFTILYGTTLNVGRVLSPTLALLVQREAQICAFQSTPFYVPEISCGSFTASGEKMVAMSDAADPNCRYHPL